MGLSIGLSAELLLYIVLWTCDSTKPWFSPCHQDKREGLGERKTERKEERKKREKEGEEREGERKKGEEREERMEERDRGMMCRLLNV